MNFQLKNFLILKTLKTFYSEYYLMLVYYLITILKNYLNTTISLNSKTVEINILIDLLFFKVTNLTSYSSDTIQDFNPKLLIYVPLKVRNLINGNIKLVYYLLGEIPKYSVDKTLIINGLKKTFLSKLTSNTTGLFFNTFTKNNLTVIYARLNVSKNITFNIVLEEDTCFIIFNNIKYNLFYILYLLGISIKDILNYSRHKTSFYLKQLLLSSSPKSTKYIYNSIENLSFLLNNTFTLNKYYIFNNFLKKNNINFKDTFFNTSNIIILDFIAILDILIDIKYNKITLSTLDHLDTRSISNIGEYIASHFKLFLKKISSYITEDITNFISLNVNKINSIPKIYIRSKKYFNLKEYLTINPLIQYLEQINSFSEIIHKNRVINYNSKTQQNIQIRNINLNQIGSLCLLDTTEGINCGLVVSFTKYVKAYKKNNFQVPYSLVLDKKTKEFIKFINSYTQETYFVIFNNYYLRKNKIFHFLNIGLTKGSFKIKNIVPQNTLYISPLNLFSYSENLIPFLFYNDPVRCLMGAKMQAQSVPTYSTTKSFIITGYEKDILNSNTLFLKTYQEGIVTTVSSLKINIRDVYNRTIVYYLNKYKRSNQSTIIHQKPIVWVGERVFCGQLLVSTQDIIHSEFTTGNNLLVCYGNFFGYNFEDAIVINKKIIYSQLFTSLHFNIYEVLFKKTTEGTFEYATTNIPKKSFFHKRNLDSFGFIKEGSKVLNNDILVSKIVVKNLSFTSAPIFNLIYILFGQEIRNIKDTSIYVPFGNSGRVVKTELFSNSLETSSYFGYYLKYRIYICKQRMLSVGDKLCGRHGNKGVIAYIAPTKDLPYSTTGQQPDIITDSLGIPSRMNIGQLFESLFGLNCYYNNIRMSITNTFNLPKNYIKSLLYSYSKILINKTGNKKTYTSYTPGQILLRDGRTGNVLLEPSFLGVSKYSKLIHMVKDKIHYRTIGPYTELMQQPIKGRNKKGGQRFGEMEVWAMEAYGSSYNLRELLNYKSDDISARTSLLTSLTKHNNLETITVPESFRTLIREINSMSLNIEATSTIDQLNGRTIDVNINY